jgi:hypothetical protein
MNKVRLYPPGYFIDGSLATNFMGGNEIVLISDSGKYPLYNLNASVYPSDSANYNSYYNNNLIYVSTNMNNGLLNRAGVNGTTSTILTFNRLSTEAGTDGNFYEDGTAANNSPSFVVKLSNAYINDMYILKEFGSRITVTFASITNPPKSYSFEVTSLTYQGNNWRFANPNVQKPTDDRLIFGLGEVVSFTYTYTQVPFISSFSRSLTVGFNTNNIIYNEARFISGNSKTNPAAHDPATYLEIANVGTASPISTIAFYNILNNSVPVNPIRSISTAGTRVVGYMQYENFRFFSTFTTTGSEVAQFFKV